jgi:acyl carrier protein
MEIAPRVMDFINEEILRGEGIVIQRDSDPLLEGAIDSVGLLHLVAFVEEEFDIEIDDAEIVPDNFSTASSVEGLVRRLMEEKARTV